jgi:predicted enzyme related to lactoylglutathione lyase
MYQVKNIDTTIFFVFFIQLLTSCGDNTKTTIEHSNNHTMIKNSNPVVYFEIPVDNIDRAVKFYKSVFDVNFDKDKIDNNEMALFPFDDKNAGISGALVKGEIYKPTKDGVLIYFKTENIDKTLKLATSFGGKMLYPKTDTGIGLVAEFEDTEGNRIALYQSKE